jgi:hypothetical protein
VCLIGAAAIAADQQLTSVVSTAAVLLHEARRVGTSPSMLQVDGQGNEVAVDHDECVAS